MVRSNFTSLINSEFTLDASDCYFFVTFAGSYSNVLTYQSVTWLKLIMTD